MNTDVAEEKDAENVENMHQEIFASQDSAVGSLLSSQEQAKVESGLSLGPNSLSLNNSLSESQFSRDEKDDKAVKLAGQKKETFISNLNKRKNASDLSDSDEREGAEVVKKSRKEIDLKASELCVICLTRAKTGSIIHGKTGHQVCCYRCAKRLKMQRKSCPVCRRPIQKVIRNYI